MRQSGKLDIGYITAQFLRIVDTDDITQIQHMTFAGVKVTPNIHGDGVTPLTFAANITLNDTGSTVVNAIAGRDDFNPLHVFVGHFVPSSNQRYLRTVHVQSNAIDGVILMPCYDSTDAHLDNVSTVELGNPMFDRPVFIGGGTIGEFIIGGHQTYSPLTGTLYLLDVTDLMAR